MSKKSDSSVLVFAMLFLFLALISTNIGKPTGHVILPEWHCEDRDHKNFFLPGKTFFEEESFIDYCHDGSYLLEYICNDNTLGFVTHLCAKGCTAGKCNSPNASEGEFILDIFPIKTAKDNLEISEYINEVIKPITNRDLSILANGSIITSSGTTSYHQVISFEGDNITSGRVLYEENEEAEMKDYLIFNHHDNIFSYKLYFDQGLKSEIAHGKLPDLLNKELSIIGNTYEIVAAEFSNDEVQIDLLGGEIKDTIVENETKTYTTYGETYNITLLYVNDATKEATLLVNGKEMPALEEAEIKKIPGKEIYLGIANVVISEGVKNNDRVTFYFDAQHLQFFDKYNNNEFEQGIAINRENIPQGFSKIRGQEYGSIFNLISIEYRMQSEAIKGGQIFIPPGKGLREYLQEPESMLFPWDILYEGIDQAIKKRDIAFDARSNNRYEMEFNNTRGMFYNIPIVANVNGQLLIGRNGKDLHFIESTSTNNFIVSTPDLMVFTDKNDDTGGTTILEYESISADNGTLTFDDLLGSKITTTWTGVKGTNATATFTVNGNTHTVYIGSNDQLAVDLNGDGLYNGTETHIVVEGGGLIDLGSVLNPITDFDITLTTQSKRFEGSAEDEIITITIQQKGNNIDLTLPSQEFINMQSQQGIRTGLSKFGVFITEEKNGPDANELTIEYPEEQATVTADLIFYGTHRD